MKTNNFTIYAAYGDQPSLYSTKEEIPEGVEMKKFKDCETAVLSMYNQHIGVYHDYTNLGYGQKIFYCDMGIEKQDQAVVYIKGGYDKETNCFSYGMIFTSIQGGIEEYDCKEYDIYGMRHITGELEAAKAATIRALCLGIRNLTIVSDYIGVEKFATCEWSGCQPGTEKYQNWMIGVNMEMNLQFVISKIHTGKILHDRAEILAKKVLTADLL